MKFVRTSLPEVLIIKPTVFQDHRGFFMETYQEKKFAEAGIQNQFVQDNHTGSQQGALRGLHYQIRFPQGKLVKVIAGEIFDVAVDIRQSSPNCGKWVGVTLSSENKHQLWVPPEFAHGYYVVSEWAEVVYKTTDIYAPQWERTILWNDPGIGIEWPILPGTMPLLSEKDMRGKNLKDVELFD